MKNRRDFLKTACKPIVLATLGIPIIEACSSDEEQPEMATQVGEENLDHSFVLDMIQPPGIQEAKKASIAAERQPR